MFSRQHWLVTEPGMEVSHRMSNSSAFVVVAKRTPDGEEQLSSGAHSVHPTRVFPTSTLFSNNFIKVIHLYDVR